MPAATAHAQQSDEEESLFELPEEEEENNGEEEEDAERVERDEEKSLDEMTREEAIEAGFVFGEEDEDDSRNASIFLAATAGLFAHGVGHWSIEERDTAVFLFGMQGASLALVGGALGWQALSEDSPSSRSYTSTALVAGGGLFGLSYLLDVLGTTYDTDLGFPSNRRRTRGIALGTNYTFHDLEGYETDSLQMLGAEAIVDMGWGYVRARTDHDVQLETSGYGGTLGTRFGQGPNPHSYLFAEVEGEMLGYSQAGRFRRLGGQALVGLSVGLGDWFGHLRQVAAGASVGAAARRYALPVGEGDDFEASSWTSHIPVETFIHLNLSERLNARAAYANREGSLIQSGPRGVGVGSLQLQYESGRNLDLVLGAEAGGGLALSAGLRLWLWE
ncbi:MAG: hypothetical protein ACOCV2_10110 [Persicimonas sp.]